MRKLKRYSVFFVVTLILLLAVSCQNDINFDDVKNPDSFSNSDWMGRLSGNASEMLISDIVIPGTHDSCSNNDFLGLSSTAAAQDLSLKQQLAAGVRFFDVRPCEVAGTLVVTHGPALQHISVSEVLRTFSDFLGKHHNEFIIMAVQPEWLDERDNSNIFNFFCSEEIKQEFDSILLKGCDLTSLTLEQCRGKIILVSRDYKNVPISERSLYCTPYKDIGVTYTAHDLQKTWNQFNNLISGVVASKTVGLNATFLSCYLEGQFGIPNIRIASSYLNPLLLEFLANTATKNGQYGVIVCDHITGDICNSIINLNNLNP